VRDSGGPLYDSANKVLVGVVSWGEGCTDEVYPGVNSPIFSQGSRRHWVSSKRVLKQIPFVVRDSTRSWFLINNVNEQKSDERKDKRWHQQKHIIIIVCRDWG